MGWLKKLFEGSDRVLMDLLVEQARIGVEGVEALCRYMATGDAEQAEKVHKAQKEAHETRRILAAKLRRASATLFDREQLHGLSRAIDGVLDHASTSVAEMEALRVAHGASARQLTDSLLVAVQGLQGAIARIRQHPNVANEHLRGAKKAGRRLQTSYRRLVADAFDEVESVEDVVTMLKRREIYRHLVQAGRRVDEAADIIAEIVARAS